MVDVTVVAGSGVAVGNLDHAELAARQEIVNRERPEIVRMVDMGDAALADDLLDRPTDALCPTLLDLGLHDAFASLDRHDLIAHAEHVDVIGRLLDLFALPDGEPS